MYIQGIQFVLVPAEGCLVLICTDSDPAYAIWDTVWTFFLHETLYFYLDSRICALTPMRCFYSVACLPALPATAPEPSPHLHTQEPRDASDYRHAIAEDDGAWAKTLPQCVVV